MDRIIDELARVTCEEFYGDEPEPEVSEEAPASRPTEQSEPLDSDLPF